MRDGRHDRAHLGVQFQAVLDLERLGALNKLGHDLVSHIAHQHGDRNRHAALAGRAIGRADQTVHGLVQVGVGHHHHVVLGAAQGLHAFAMMCTGLVDVVGDRCGADETHRLHIGVHQQRVHRLLVALHHIEHAVGQPRLFEQVSHEQGRRWVDRAGLEDEGVTRGNSHRVHPHRHHHGEVEGCDADHHTEGLAQGPVVHAGGNLIGEVALEQLRNAAGKFHDVDTARHLALRIGKHFAVFSGDQAGQVVLVVVQQFEELEHHARAAQRRRVGPGREGGLRGSYGSAYFSGVGQCHMAGDGPAGGVEDILRAAGGAGDYAAADIVINICFAHDEFLDRFDSVAKFRAIFQ